MDKELAKEALRQRLKEGQATMKCTILRKKIRPVNADKDEGRKFERVIFCSDPRQIKGFNKRKHKHEVKTKRTKKTSLKEKMQTSKPFLDDKKPPLRSGVSETSSVLLPSTTSVLKEPVKIKIGH